jgi:ferritin-like metal-binding protein YciE
MSINSLRDLFFDQLRDLYSVETQLLEALPELERSASEPELRELFREHADVTTVQRNRLLQIFSKHQENPEGDQSKAMKGLCQGGSEHIRTVTDPAVKDALIIAHANRIEHYEIAAYGVALAIAEALDLGKEADALAESVAEEKQMDQALTRLAVGGLFKTGLNELAAEAVPD